MVADGRHDRTTKWTWCLLRGAWSTEAQPHKSAAVRGRPWNTGGHRRPPPPCQHVWFVQQCLRELRLPIKSLAKADGIVIGNRVSPFYARSSYDGCGLRTSCDQPTSLKWARHVKWAPTCLPLLGHFIHWFIKKRPSADLFMYVCIQTWYAQSSFIYFCHSTLTSTTRRRCRRRLRHRCQFK